MHIVALKGNVVKSHASPRYCKKDGTLARIKQGLPDDFKSEYLPCVGNIMPFGGKGVCPLFFAMGFTSGLPNRSPLILWDNNIQQEVTALFKKREPDFACKRKGLLV